MNHCEIHVCVHTHTHTHTGRVDRSVAPDLRPVCMRGDGGRGGWGWGKNAGQIEGRSIDIVMLITPHIYRSSDSIGGVKEERRGEMGPYLAIWSNIWAERLLNVHPLPQPPEPRQFGWDICVQVGCAPSYCTPTTIPPSLLLGCYE